MRVLINVPFISGGGAEFVATQWARFLAEAGDVVTLYTTHPRDDDAAPGGVALVKAKRGGILKQARDLAAHLRAEPVDVVVSLMPYWNLMSILAVRSLGSGRPRVLVSGRTFAKEGMDGVEGDASPIQHWLARRAYRYSDLFIAISHPVGAEAVTEYRLHPGKVVVVPNPALAKVQDYLDVAGPLSTVATSPNAHLDLVVPARLVAPKRPLVAIDVAVILSRDKAAFPGGVTVHFFGSGPLEKSVRARADAAGVDVLMHGWVNNWFAECPPGSVVLLPSIAEGFGNVLIEAAGAGLRSVVSSRCRGGADAVVPGITGELIAGDSPEEYASAVKASVGKGVHGANSWLQRFSRESSGGILRNVLVKLVSGVERQQSE